jgi:hypothetical protein
MKTPQDGKPGNGRKSESGADDSIISIASVRWDGEVDVDVPVQPGEGSCTHPSCFRGAGSLVGIAAGGRAAQV